MEKTQEERSCEYNAKELIYALYYGLDLSGWKTGPFLFYHLQDNISFPTEWVDEWERFQVDFIAYKFHRTSPIVRRRERDDIFISYVNAIGKRIPRWSREDVITSEIHLQHLYLTHPFCKFFREKFTW